MSQKSNDKPDAGRRGQQVTKFHYVEQSASSVPCEKTPAEWENWDPGSQISSYPYYLSSSLSYLLLISEGPNFFKENEKVTPNGTFTYHVALWILS